MSPSVSLEEDMYPSGDCGGRGHLVFGPDDDVRFGSQDESEDADFGFESSSIDGDDFELFFAWSASLHVLC